MRKTFYYFLINICFLQTGIIYAQEKNTTSYKQLLQRIIPEHAMQFKIEPLPADKTKDAFEIESLKQKIVLRGNTGVAIASALYYYLNEYCHTQITWNGTNLSLPVELPKPKNKIH